MSLSETGPPHHWKLGVLTGHPRVPPWALGTFQLGNLELKRARKQSLV